MHCPECGFVNGEGANYCQKCGAFLAAVGESGGNATTAQYQLDDEGELKPVDPERAPDGGVLVDTPGFLPGSEQEAMGVIRHGAGLLHAFAEATVPRVTVVLRKAFGGAYITMNSKDLGADVVFSWPNAQIGIMAARQAVGIVHGRRLREDESLSRDDLADAYAAEHLTAPAAAASGWVDEVIDPEASRESLAWALRSLRGR